MNFISYFLYTKISCYFNIFYPLKNSIYIVLRVFNPQRLLKLGKNNFLLKPTLKLIVYISLQVYSLRNFNYNRLKQI